MEPKQIAYDICRCYLNDLRDVDSALVEKIRGYHRSRNLAELASCSRHFDMAKHAVKEWRALRQVEAFFKKNSIFSDKEVCFQSAASAFKKAEAMCRETNLRLLYFYAKRYLLDTDLSLQVNRMERYISNVLGPFTPFLDALPSLVRVTSGATFDTSRAQSIPQRKMKMKVTVTPLASAFINALYLFRGFERPTLKVSESNRIELVPKNWKTDRTIACEPEGNLPLQLAFDSYAKRRLRRFGIDLSDQSANQKLAHHASIHDDFVTVDFEAASDTISLNTVAWLFPVDWYDYLYRVRTPQYSGALGTGYYQKFSSMGNGSTFTIETLIFAAACYAVGSKNFLVYGDDVIIEKEFYASYLRLTRFLGFTINTSKSFHEGPFRESCGFDVFNGTDVTPVYIRCIDRRKTVLCHLVNTLGCLVYPGCELEKYLFNLVKEYKLPLVPFQENTTSGIWILPDLARDQGILRRCYSNIKGHHVRYKRKGYFDTGIDEFKSFLPSSKKRLFRFHRGYYLWFLNATKQVVFSGPWDSKSSYTCSQTSSVPLFQHRYVRKWVVWVKPNLTVPDHLYWWSDHLVS